jgi:predicted O-methyltransferase YrrM
VAITTKAKVAANQALRKVNLKIDTLTAEAREAARIGSLRRRGYFDRPTFSLLPGFAEFSPDALAAALTKYSTGLDALMRGAAQPGGYDPANPFFRSPDAEVLYLMVRSLAPRRVVEVGSGNSTRIIRQAIADGGLSVEHVAIDPAPRSDIACLVNRMHLDRFEEVSAEPLLAELRPGDVLFIDSSHEVRVGNDVARLFCTTLPALADGVIVHVHDVFLPFDYPVPFCTECPGWGEQYLLQLLLQHARHEVLWPGYYLQKLKPETAERLPFLAAGRAQSLWFRIRNRG